jgi:Icc-related predicted phosphoesterase
MKIIYATDLHGNVIYYQQLLELAKREGADIIIIGGDILPKDGHFKALIEKQGLFIKETLHPMFAEFKAACPGVSIYTMMGNDDWASNMPLLEEMEGSGLLNLLHKKVYSLDGRFFIAGYGCVPPTPFSIKDWERLDELNQFFSEEGYSCISTENGISRIDSMTWFYGRKTIKEELEEIALLSSPANTIYIFHAPPYGTALDMMPGKTHIGSKAVREFIEKRQPLLTLHGHIHESPAVSGKYMDIIGRTIAVNPGQREDRLQAVVFKIPDILSSIRDIEL